MPADALPPLIPPPEAPPPHPLRRVSTLDCSGAPAPPAAPAGHRLLYLRTRSWSYIPVALLPPGDLLRSRGKGLWQRKPSDIDKVVFPDDSRAGELCGDLHAAAGKGWIGAVRYLLARGANVNLRCRPSNRTALMVVAGPYKALGIQSPAGGFTTIMDVLQANFTTIMDALLSHSADLDLQDVNGDTALTVAAATQDHDDFVQALLHAGANTELRGKDGTAREIADIHAQFGRQRTARLIREAEPKEIPKEVAPETALKNPFRFRLPNEKLFWWYISWFIWCFVLIRLCIHRLSDELFTLRDYPLFTFTSAASAASSVIASVIANFVYFCGLTPAANPTAATTPSARELASMAALQVAIDSKDLASMIAAINTHAAAANGTDVLTRARTLRNRLRKAEARRRASRAAPAAETPAAETPAAETPNDYICSITVEIMTDPVFTSDGNSYERAAITEWLRTHDTSPRTGAVLANKTLVPNITLRNIIRNFLEAHPE